MIKRLLKGLIIGGVLGALVAAGLVRMGYPTFDTAALGMMMAYGVAAALGALTGLVSGKPIWSADGKIEAGLKAVFGALLSVGVSFAVRRWVHVSFDLSSLHQGMGPAEVGQLPALMMPFTAALLGGFFELDNTPEPSSAERDPKQGKRVGTKNVRVAKLSADTNDDDADSAEASARRARRL